MSRLLEVLEEKVVTTIHLLLNFVGTLGLDNIATSNMYRKFTTSSTQPCIVFFDSTNQLESVIFKAGLG